MAVDTQFWLDNPGSNFGWLLDGSDAACSVKGFNSREHPTVRPTLTIDYSPPPPPREPAGGAIVSTVFLRDTALGRTLDLNGIVGPGGSVAPEELDVDGTQLLANATNPVISPYGNTVLFESMAQNIDSVRPDDENRVMDVVLVDLSQFESQGFVLPYNLSVTPDGGNANGPSHSPRFGAFSPPTDAFPLGIALFATQATNLGNSDPGDLDGDGVPENDNFVLSFLREGGTVFADFEAQPARQGIDRGVVFESTSSGEPDTFLWDFGDGSPTSTEASPAHVYTTPGLYTVSLTASGSLGADDRTRIDYVHVLGPVVAKFFTDKDASQAPAQAPANGVSFEMPIPGAIDDPDPTSALLFDSTSQESTEFPDTFAWTLTPVDFGGTPIGAPVIVSDEANAEDVRIDSVGFYELKLEATGPGGAGIASQRLQVFQKVDAAFTTNPAGAIVRGPANLLVQFTDASTGDLLDVNAHAWDFGDGAFSNEADPAHTFAEGVSFVNLTVFGKGTDSDRTVNVPVIADGVITAAFTATPEPAGSVAGLLAAEAIADGAVLVDFANESQHQSGSPLFFRWSFGTGALTGQETVADPVDIAYVLTDPEDVETFSVSLVTSTTSPAPANCGGQPVGTCDERPGTVTLFPRPIVSFTPPGPSFAGGPLRPPHTVQLTGSVIGDGAGTDPEYRWLRSAPNGTGATIPFATGLAPLFEFEDPGSYEVALEVETNAPGGTRQTEQSPVGVVFVSASTLTEWLAQAVDPASGAKCTNCHKGANPPAGLNWQGTPAEIFDRIVEDDLGTPALSQRCNTARRRIEPGDAENSVVYNVLLKPPGPLCQINMRPNLPGTESDKDAHVAVLRSWIMSGAPEN